MRAIEAIKAEITECKQEREGVAPLLDKAHKALEEAKTEFERHQKHSIALSLRIERLTEARRTLEGPVSNDDTRPDVTTEDFIRATATAVGTDPDDAVEHWQAGGPSVRDLRDAGIEAHLRPTQEAIEQLRAALKDTQ